MTDEQRRVWTRRTGDQGSLSISLKAFEALYEAARPLSRPELAAALAERLDSSERAYLEAWALHCRARMAASKARRQHKAPAGSLENRFSSEPAKSSAVALWLGIIFDNRRTGSTLIRDADGRYRPGPKPPRMATGDGRLIAFTPEARAADEAAGRAAAQENAQIMEWRRVSGALDGLPSHERLTVLVFLARRFAGFAKTNNPRNKPSMTDTQLRSRFNHILRSAHDPACTPSRATSGAGLGAAGQVSPAVSSAKYRRHA